MLKPDSISVPELAVRWEQPVSQILRHAEKGRLALCFRFDGTAFDAADRWHRVNGDHAHQMKLTQLREDVDRDESKVRAASQDERVELRKRIDANNEKVERLVAELEERDAFRANAHYRGDVRASPETLSTMVKDGAAAFPRFGYRPDRPVSLEQERAGQQVLEGHIIALEPSERPPALTPADLFASYAEVEAIDAAERQAPQAAEVARPLSRGAAQDAFILATIRDLGLKPRALVEASGALGDKGKVLAACKKNPDWRKWFSSDSVFNKRWTLLRGGGQIGNPRNVPSE